VFNKRRWSDGLHDDFDHLDEFEAKFYCFGGDGGGSSGGSSNSNSKQNQRADEQEPVRGGRRGAAAPAPSLSPSQQATMDQVSAAAQQSLDAKNPAVQDFQDRLAAGQFDAAPQSMATAPSAPSAFDAVSFSQPTSSGIGSLPDFSNLSIGSVNAPVNTEQAYSAATAPQTVGGLANALGIDTSANIGGFNIGFGSTPGVSGVSGPTVNVGPGQLGVGTNMAGDQFGVGYNMKFANGGIVSLRRR